MMPLHVEEPLRVQLEGGATLLEHAYARIGRVTRALERWRWRAHVLSALNDVRAQVNDEPQLDALMHHLEVLSAHSAQAASAWRAMTEQRESLRRQLERRGCSGTSVEAALKTLERLVLGDGRFVWPHQRWAVAVGVLPDSLEAFAELSFDARELSIGEVLPSPEAWGRLRPRLLAVRAALDSLWARLEDFDEGGSLATTLKRRAQKPVLRLSSEELGSGPARLLTFEHQSVLTVRALTRIAAAAVAPVQVMEGETLAVIEWLVHGRFETGAPVGLARQALCEVALALNGRSEVAFEPLHVLAREADTERSEDWHRVLRVATLTVEAAKMRGRRLPPLYAAANVRSGGPATLADAIRLVRETAGQ